MSTLRRRLLVALASLIILILGLEIFARLALGVRPKLERFKLDPQLGWTWNPGYDAEEVFYGVTYRMTISEQGLRNGLVEVPKPADTFRIIALGDSVTEGPGVELDQTFAKLIEEELQQTEPAKRIEVVNAAVGDYGTSQESMWLQLHGLEFKPDFVVVNVYLNDSRIHNNPPTIVAALDSLLGRNSAFYYHYRSLVRELRLDAEVNQPGFRFRFSETWESGSWRDDPNELTRLIKEADRDWGLAWIDSELSTIQDGLKDIAELGDRHGFIILVVLFPVNVQVESETTTSLGLDKPQQSLIDFASEESIPILDLLPILRLHRDRDLYHDQAHLTAEGHQIVATSIAKSIVDTGLLDGN